MGKGNRSRNNRYDEAYQMTGSGAAAVGKKDRTSTVILAVIALLIVGAILLYAFAASGIVGRGDVVVSSENYKIDANMMTYYQNLAYSNTFQQYYSFYYLYLYAGDADAAYAAVQNMMSQYTLKSFFDAGLTTAKEVLVLCEGAKAAGVELDEEDLALIDEQVESFEGSFAETFGTGVNKSDIRKAMTLYQLAAKYAEIKNEEIEGAITDEELQKYIEENKKDFYSVSYLAYEFSINASSYTDNEAGFTAAKELAEKYALALGLAKTEDEFRTAVVNYIVDRDFKTEFDKNVGEATVPETAVLDAAKAKIFTKIGKEMAVAIKAGGPDPTNNSRLRDLIAKAKANNVPNDNIDRIIKKAAGETGGADYEEIVYEGYGPSGVAVIVEALTDNRNRTAGDVRHYFDKYGGNMGQSGCVSFMFSKQGVLVVEAGEKSGSLITAKRAAEQSRDVYAIPGSILTTAYNGANALIRDGAKAVAGARDILAAYAVIYPDRLDLDAISDTPITVEKPEEKKKSKTTEKQNVSGLDPDCAAVYNLFGEEALHPDEICAATGLSLSKVISALMQLQMTDYIEIDGGKNYRLK